MTDDNQPPSMMSDTLWVLVIAAAFTFILIAL